jgi:hypothetical protein
MIMTDKLEAILWSIALPGFAQLLNRKFLKGIVFIFFEFLVNVKSPLITGFTQVANEPEGKKL